MLVTDEVRMTDHLVTSSGGFAATFPSRGRLKCFHYEDP